MRVKVFIVALLMLLLAPTTSSRAVADCRVSNVLQATVNVEPGENKVVWFSKDDKGLDIYPTIEAAIAAVAEGGTVIVCSNTHSDVIITKPLTLKARQGEQATVNGSIIIEASDVHIEGLKLDRTGSARYTIWVKDGSGIVIRDNAITTIMEGIVISGGNDVSIIGNTIILTSTKLSTSGIQIGSTRSTGEVSELNVNLAENVITGNQEKEAKRTGIYVRTRGIVAVDGQDFAAGDSDCAQALGTALEQQVGGNIQVKVQIVNPSDTGDVWYPGS